MSPTTLTIKGFFSKGKRLLFHLVGIIPNLVYEAVRFRLGSGRSTCKYDEEDVP